MRSETGQKETPAPITVAKGGRGSSEVNAAKVQSSFRPVKSLPRAWAAEPGPLAGVLD